jgi:hypothetical protein
MKAYVVVSFVPGRPDTLHLEPHTEADQKQLKTLCTHYDIHGMGKSPSGDYLHVSLPLKRAVE